MKLLVCGSRTVTDYKMVRFCLDRLLYNLGVEQSDLTTVITGGARGADELAHRWARDREMFTWVVRADWKLHGRSAGFIRNQQMLELRPSIVFGIFQDHQTKGTLDMLQRSKNAGIDTRYVVIK